MLSDGSELEPLSRSDLRKTAKKIIRERFDSVAITFLNSYANPKHEKETEKILRKEGVRAHIDLSSQVDREYREFERMSTTAVNSCLVPLVSEYLARLEIALRKKNFRSPIYVMNSDGSASTIEHISKYPIFMIESGPAAGVLASREIGRSLSIEKIITFDMGGTTAKAGAVIGYEPDIAYEFEAAGKMHSGRSIKGSGYAVRAPFIDLAEVSAGGGTIAWVDEGGVLKVGPLSAGSDPGPVAYGKGGNSPTVTDANLVLGRLGPEGLLGGKLPLDRELAHGAIRKFLSEKLRIGVDEAAQGIIRLANNSMARAISIVSVERGRDPREHTLVAFGGAGPIHACDLAEELGIASIIVPLHPGLFSAYGLLTADLQRNFSLPVLKNASEVDAEDYFAELRASAASALRKEGEFKQYNSREYVDLRYRGQSFEITIPYEKGKDLTSIFGERHSELYGYSSDDPVEIVNAKLIAVVPTAKAMFSMKEAGPHASTRRRDSAHRRVWFPTGYLEASVLSRDLFEPGKEGGGPCIIEEYDSTTVVNPGWSWKVDSYGNLVLKEQRAGSSQ